MNLSFALNPKRALPPSRLPKPPPLAEVCGFVELPIRQWLRYDHHRLRPFEKVLLKFGWEGHKLLNFLADLLLFNTFQLYILCIQEYKYSSDILPLSHHHSDNSQAFEDLPGYHFIFI